MIYNTIISKYVNIMRTSDGNAALAMLFSKNEKDTRFQKKRCLKQFNYCMYFGKLVSF